MKTKTSKLLEMLQKRWMTPLDMLYHCSLLSGVQRISEMRRDGWVIRDQWVRTAGGARVKAYRAFGKSGQQ